MASNQNCEQKVLLRSMPQLLQFCWPECPEIEEDSDLVGSGWHKLLVRSPLNIPLVALLILGKTSKWASEDRIPPNIKLDRCY